MNVNRQTVVGWCAVLLAFVMIGGAVWLGVLGQACVPVFLIIAGVLVLIIGGVAVVGDE